MGNLVLGNDEVEKTDVSVPCICYPGYYIVECLCSYKNNYSKSFNSIELKSSEILSDIPRYRLIKNPSKASKAFYNEIIYDVGSYTNYFIAQEINGNTCRDNGEFFITGKFKDNGITHSNEFILFLTYPIEVKAKCSVISSNLIKCVSGSYFNQKEIMIEQQEAFDVYLSSEFFGITSIKSKTLLTCIVGTIDIPTENEIIQYIIDLHRTDIEEIIETEKPFSNDTIEETSENSNIPEEISISQKETIERNKPDTEVIPPVEQVSEKESYRPDTIIISPEKSDNNEYRDDEPSTKEKAQKKSEIFLSFRQISGFKYKSGIITFLIFVLATEDIEKGNMIILSVNLIKASGETEDNSRYKYKCELSGLKEEYISLRLNDSENIVGIPKDDEKSLNPVLNDKSIEKGEKLNYTDEKNIDKIPASLVFKSINQTQCKEKRIFTIKGELTKEVTIGNKFNIPLTYPDGVSIVCYLEGTNLECYLDKEIKDIIILEQIIIKDDMTE